MIIAQIILFFTKTFPITPGGWFISENIASLFIAIFYPSIPYTTILSLIILDHVLRTFFILIFGTSSTILLNFNIKSFNSDKIRSKEGNQDKKKENNNVTRGFGILEQFLSMQRMKKAEKLISKNDKNGKILDIDIITDEISDLVFRLKILPKAFEFSLQKMIVSLIQPIINKIVEGR